MDASATEPGCLTHGVHPRQRRAVRPQRSTIEVGLQATKGLARQHMQPDSDQRAARSSPADPRILRIEQLVRAHDAHQPVTEKPARRRRGHNLRILTEPAAYLEIARLDQLLQRFAVNQMLADQLIHLSCELQYGSRREKIDTPLLECAYLRRRTGSYAASQQPQILPSQIAILL